MSIGAVDQAYFPAQPPALTMTAKPPECECQMRGGVAACALPGCRKLLQWETSQREGDQLPDWSKTRAKLTVKDRARLLGKHRAINTLRGGAAVQEPCQDEDEEGAHF